MFKSFKLKYLTLDLAKDSFGVSTNFNGGKIHLKEELKAVLL